ncbi:hypothetical protein CEXT_812141 [Caerostris extrusa]|uniref:Uncharacterized protein n=1 Tax=Caerostris extrusa TaxID=172846 RepID=A0AAV4TDJ4_CAEEX|nr:hypothetical protein CEXT_812141 [Caerostris extrusa]
MSRILIELSYWRYRALTAIDEVRIKSITTREDSLTTKIGFLGDYRLPLDTREGRKGGRGENKNPGGKVLIRRVERTTCLSQQLCCDT